MRSWKILLTVLLGISLSGCSYNYSFLIVNLTAHDVVVIYKRTPGVYGGGLTSDPQVFSAREDDGYWPDSLLHEPSFGQMDSVRVVLPPRTLLSDEKIGNPDKSESYAGMAWLMIVRTELGDTLKIPGSMIIELVEEVNNRDFGLIINDRPSSL